MRKVVIADYGVGNLRSVTRAVAHCGFEPVLGATAAEIEQAERIILPGVGAFGSCVAALRNQGLIKPLLRAMNDGRPVLGICVGMQMLFDASAEFGDHAGLGHIPGRVLAIPEVGSDGKPHKIPHIGWSGLNPAGVGWKETIFDSIEPGSACYFVHSFSAVPQHADSVLATCDFNGVRICAAARVGNVYGVQFHPEKSGAIGLSIFASFLNLTVG